MLRSRNIDVEQLSLKQPLPSKDSIWIGTVDEIASKSSEGRPIAADLSSIEMALEAAIFALKGSQRNTPLYARCRYGTTSWPCLVYGRCTDRYQTNRIREGVHRNN